MTGAPVIVATAAALRDWAAGERRQGRSLALVPTMGALHDGHLELVRQGLAAADRVVVSIFVNPTQFGPQEDFAAYPRTWDADLAKLAQAGAQAVYRPAVDAMYPAGAATTLAVAGLRDELEGAVRPGHFDGVATIVAKLLLQAMPDVALFGEKDYQQLAVIRRLATDLCLPARIVGVPTVRDARGLALSSRNAYLSPAQLERAVRLNDVLRDIVGAVEGGTPWLDAAERGAAALAAAFDAVDYLAVRDAATLQMPDAARRSGLRVLAAVRLGGTRLIDNMAIC